MSRLIKKTEDIHKNFSKYGKDKNWIERNFKEGNWKKIRDISKKSNLTENIEPETPAISPLSPKRPFEDDLGQGKRIKYPNSKYR